MTKVYTTASMSLDGFIAGPQESGFDRLHRWHDSGNVAIPMLSGKMTLRLSEASALHWREMAGTAGAGVIGRRLFDLTNGWGGDSPTGEPVFVVTHSVPDDWNDRDTTVPFTFVTDGVASAIEQAKAVAGDKYVNVAAGTIARQALELGLLDEVWIDLMPVFLGAGVPYLSELGGPVDLEGPIATLQGNGVTHLRYRVAR
ncbi:dihydrofolate reductase family protein [Actinomadura madurae]|uniref:dihydrofolate reductase family protein n=2 Tax=Actinomadura madurae TaxID=1993 RepID=UPI0020D21150|nr:dihydrofolate reductase family protein [Actinomadura madurae]MCQ0005577.1 dihydrofolate reductase family protein [Actinomadura madurae]